MSDSAPSPTPRVAVILLAGGRGRRAGFTQPKQLEPLGGKPVLRWSLDAFAAHPAISAGVLVAGDDVVAAAGGLPAGWLAAAPGAERPQSVRSEEHTSELQSLMRISYAVFCLKKKNHNSHPP